MDNQFNTQQTSEYSIGNVNYQVTRIFNKKKDIKTLLFEKITSAKSKSQN